MKNLKFKYLSFSFILLSIVLGGCEKDESSSNPLNNYVGVAETYRKVSIYPGETLSLEAKIFATEAQNVDRTFSIIVDTHLDSAHGNHGTTLDSGSFTLPETVTLPAGQKTAVFNVGITGVNIGSGKKLVIKLGQLLGTNTSISDVWTDDNDLVEDSDTQRMTFDIEERCDFNKCVLSIKFDNYPEETAWELYDSSNNVVASGGLSDDGTTIIGYAADYPDQGTFTTNLCLQSGTYTFVIYDDYGDGMYTSASVQGNYSLKLGSTVLASGSGNFGSFQDTTFTLP